MVKTQTPKRLCAVIGVGATLYGTISLAFELLNKSFSNISLAVWMALNPVFVAVVKSGVVGNMSALSFFADLSTPGLALATLVYWGWPIGLIIIGAVLLFSER